MNKTVLFALFILCAITSHGQKTFSLVTGNIVSEDSLQPVPNAHVISKTSLYAAIADADGKFSIRLRNIDTLWVSCVGFEDGNFIVNRDEYSDKELIIKIKRAVVVLDEVNVLPYLDRETFKQIVISIPFKQPLSIPHATKTVDPAILNKDPIKQPPASIMNPVSFIYNRFNKKEKLKRKMLRNRKKYNEMLIKQGAPDSLLLPEKLEFYDDDY